MSKNILFLIIINFFIYSNLFYILASDIYTCNSDSEYSKGKTEFYIKNKLIVKIIIYEDGQDTVETNNSGGWWEYLGNGIFYHQLLGQKNCEEGKNERKFESKKVVDPIVSNEYATRMCRKTLKNTYAIDSFHLLDTGTYHHENNGRITVTQGFTDINENEFRAKCLIISNEEVEFTLLKK